MTKTVEQPKKKGKASWKPAGDQLEVYEKKDGFRYRWCRKDDGNIARKEQEGWVPVNKETGLPAEHRADDGVHGSGIGGTQYKESVLMALPEDVAVARDAYFTKLTDDRTKLPTTELKTKAANMGADIRGKVVIE